MNILLFGATGRVGESITELVLDKGHQLTVFVRDKSKMKLQHAHLHAVEGDIYNVPSLDQLKVLTFDVIINVAGANPLKPSTLVTDAARVISTLFSGKPVRYLAITGIAQMKKTLFGRISMAILKLTPIKNAIRDHQHAFDIIQQSGLNWALTGCPYIKDGPTKGKFKTRELFPGGFKIIHPGDVAIAIVNELELNNRHKITGIWY
jgi:putative NADH-flavin reductase